MQFYHVILTNCDHNKLKTKAEWKFLVNKEQIIYIYIPFHPYNQVQVYQPPVDNVIKALINLFLLKLNYYPVSDFQFVRELNIIEHFRTLWKISDVNQK